jgi:hypothetical protein
LGVFSGGNVGTGDPQKNPYSGTNVRNIPLVYNGEDEKFPEWLMPDEWKNSRIYVIANRWGRSDSTHTQVLIYNDTLSTAYFIDDLGDYFDTIKEYKGPE